MPSAMAVLALFAMVVFPVSAAALRHAPLNSTVSVVPAHEVMKLSPQSHMQVKLGPFDSAAAACDYCFSSFTKEGNPPAGPVAPFCVCMAYNEGGWNMFCATPPSAADYVSGKDGGCRCKEHDMQAMGKTTCAKIA